MRLPCSCYIVILQEFKLNIDGNSEQAEAQEKTIRVLFEMSVRLQTIEHRMEVLHMRPPPVTTTSGMTGKEDKKTSVFAKATPSQAARVGREPWLILAQRWGRPSLAGGVLRSRLSISVLLLFSISTLLRCLIYMLKEGHNAAYLRRVRGFPWSSFDVGVHIIRLSCTYMAQIVNQIQHSALIYSGIRVLHFEKCFHLAFFCGEGVAAIGCFLHHQALHGQQLTLLHGCGVQINDSAGEGHVVHQLIINTSCIIRTL